MEEKNKNHVSEFFNSKKSETSKRRFLKEDYIPSDKKSFSQKYGRRTTLNKESENLVPEFVKKLFESENKVTLKSKPKKFVEDNNPNNSVEFTFHRFGDVYSDPNEDDVNEIVKKLFSIALNHGSCAYFHLYEEKDEENLQYFSNECKDAIWTIKLGTTVGSFTPEDLDIIKEAEEFFDEIAVSTCAEQDDLYDDDYDDE